MKIKDSSEPSTYGNGNPKNTNGLGWIVTGLFVVGDLAGGGLVALPTSMIQSGFYSGIAMAVLMTLMFGYTAHVLGKCWVILERRWPEYRTNHCRKPYPEIGGRAFGSRMKHFVSACIDISQFGTSVVYLLLSSKNIHDFLKAFFNTNISFCLIIIIVALLLLPLTFLKSPQDFWLAVVIAMFTTSLAVILILIGMTIDYPTCSEYHHMPQFKLSNYFLALGTMLFAWGGHAAFPTIQHDMKKPNEFTKSTLLAFFTIFSMYMPVCVLGYLTYGDSLRESVINSVQTKWIQQGVNLLITIHCVLALTIVFNPINQEAEHFFNVPHHFGLKRILVRSGMMLAVVFVAESIPTFGPLLDLIGSSTMVLTSLTFPCLFYLYLQASELKADEEIEKKLDIATISNSAKSPKKVTTDGKEESLSFSEVLERVDKFSVFCCTFIIAFGILGGSASTFSAIKEIGYTHFTPPCYISAFSNELNEPNVGGHINCCGYSQTETVFTNTSQFCSPPNLKFYD